MLERRGERGLAIHHYGAPDGCALDDPAAWAAANPGIALGIKSREYMAHAAARAISVPADAGAFRAFELNQPVSPSAQMIVALADYQRCVAAALPARDGDCWIALDCGGAASFTAAAAYWPVTGRCELYAGVGGIPDLQERSRADGVGDLYPQMAERGELWTYPQRETPIDRFLADVGARLDGAHVGGLVADEYRAARLRDGLDAAGLDEWAARLVIRPVRWKTGNDDCVGFQTAVITGQVTFPETLILPAAIRDSRLTADDNGNVRLDKSREHGRIDVLMAAILAVAAGQRNRELSGWDPGYHGTF